MHGDSAIAKEKRNQSERTPRKIFDFILKLKCPDEIDTMKLVMTSFSSAGVYD